MLSSGYHRAHIIRDLRPYVCTYEQCLTSEQLYDTRDDWIQHEMSTHQRIFRCFEHEEEIFTTMAAYERHVQVCHEHNALSAKFATSTMNSVQRSCPVCSVALGSIQKLQSHIALHLERFAMFSLPRHTDCSENETGSSMFTTRSENEESFDVDLDQESNVADVFRPGSPRSPTRPPSMRRRQSMHTLELEARIEQLEAENRHLSQSMTPTDVESETPSVLSGDAKSMLTEMKSPHESDRGEEEERLEQEAQRQRLAARIKARDTAGRRRRSRVVYENGTYRYDDSLEQVQDGTHPQSESVVPSVRSELEPTESTPPISEALLPIYGQLRTILRSLFAIRDAGGISSVRELYPYNMKVWTIGELPFWSRKLHHVLTLPFPLLK